MRLVGGMCMNEWKERMEEEAEGMMKYGKFDGALSSDERFIV
jgi:hypothetical protein